MAMGKDTRKRSQTKHKKDLNRSDFAAFEPYVYHGMNKRNDRKPEAELAHGKSRVQLRKELSNAKRGIIEEEE